MRWYDGGIAEAVAMSKSKNAIFVVYIEGTDEQSQTLTSLINNGDVSTKLECENFVALKLEAGSVPHSQFTEIYKNVPVPSVFFIGRTGLPIDVVNNISTTDELHSRIDNVIKSHEMTLPLKSRSAATQSEMLINKEAQQSSSEESMSRDSKEDLQTVENGVCCNIAESSSNESNTIEKETSSEEVLNDELSTDDKVQRAKEIIEKKREQQKKEEEEALRQKELERRKVGQDVQKLKRWQKDQELKEMMEERKREKDEEKAARDRILQQIAQDRADRATRFNTVSSPAASPTTTTTTIESKEPTHVGATTARIQFRLPDGSTHTSTFENTTTLAEVRRYIPSNIKLPFKYFTLSTTFPRREFTEEHNNMTLKELELCPSAVILILPGPHRVILSSEPGGLTGLIWMLFSPIFGIIGFLRNLVFGRPAPDAPLSPTSQSERNTGSQNEPIEPNQPPSGVKRRATESTSVRRQGNIHRFTDRTDSDDENNTWNGNSTQQM